MNLANISVLVFIAVLVGTLMPVQGVINSKLAEVLNHPFQSAFISFLVGTLICLIASLATKQSFSLQGLKQAPLWYFLGGLLGSCFVITSILLIGKIGATILLGSFVTGQLIMSLVIDHYGLFGIPQSPVNSLRLSGVFFLIIGLGMITKR